ncbi:HEPN family nuclease [Aquirufa salirivi]|uniref:HEPN family nuclease n=1 Tax=Aquirufa salirivi TaxID=3104729 RepID=A0ABW8RUP4_9BACT
MTDSREDIPKWTWYNGQFLFQFDEQLKQNPNMTIYDFFQEFLTNQKLQSLNIYHTKNQGTVILLLYGLLVIPKEIWEETNTNFKFESRDKFTFNHPTDKNLDTITFLRLLRNSLSHANFAIDIENKRLKFWNDYKGIKNFEVEIRYDDIGVFLSEVGKYYINEVMNKRI